MTETTTATVESLALEAGHSFWQELFGPVEFEARLARLRQAAPSQVTSEIREAVAEWAAAYPDLEVDEETSRRQVRERLVTVSEAYDAGREFADSLLAGVDAGEGLEDKAVDALVAGWPVTPADKMLIAAAIAGARDARDGFEPLGEFELRDRLRATPTLALTTAEGEAVDEDAAVRAYLADPRRFHEVTPDNPDGDPVSGLVLTAGPQWVPAEDA